ncbi:hypothetical protein PR048_010139 [Dryococelus australis]|uniref:Uncharacterized protein n=1 Tax=Dryococelus australis TaxID=614101 RepID=A0ABQ9I1V2_9NEOP|nr:hypothetical protein PR048_010139 [Dryococelus australis]
MQFSPGGRRPSYCENRGRQWLRGRPRVINRSLIGSVFAVRVRVAPRFTRYRLFTVFNQKIISPSGGEHGFSECTLPRFQPITFSRRRMCTESASCFETLDRRHGVSSFRAASHPQANRVRFPAGQLPDYRTRESCRIMPLVGEFFFGVLPFSPRLYSGAAPFTPRFALIGSQVPEVKSGPNISTPRNDNFCAEDSRVYPWHTNSHIEIKQLDASSFGIPEFQICHFVDGRFKFNHFSLTDSACERCLTPPGQRWPKRLLPLREQTTNAQLTSCPYLRVCPWCIGRRLLSIHSWSLQSLLGNAIYLAGGLVCAGKGGKGEEVDVKTRGQRWCGLTVVRQTERVREDVGVAQFWGRPAGGGDGWSLACRPMWLRRAETCTYTHVGWECMNCVTGDMNTRARLSCSLASPEVFVPHTLVPARRAATLAKLRSASYFISRDLHTRDASESIADLQGNTWQIPYCQLWCNTGNSLEPQPMNTRLRLECTQDCGNVSQVDSSASKQIGHARLISTRRKTILGRDAQHSRGRHAPPCGSIRNYAMKYPVYTRPPAPIVTTGRPLFVALTATRSVRPPLPHLILPAGEAVAVRLTHASAGRYRRNPCGPRVGQEQCVITLLLTSPACSAPDFGWKREKGRGWDQTADHVPRESPEERCCYRLRNCFREGECFPDAVLMYGGHRGGPALPLAGKGLQYSGYSPFIVTSNFSEALARAVSHDLPPSSGKRAGEPSPTLPPLHTLPQSCVKILPQLAQPTFLIRRSFHCPKLPSNLVLNVIDGREVWGPCWPRKHVEITKASQKYPYCNFLGISPPRQGSFNNHEWGAGIVGNSTPQHDTSQWDSVPLCNKAWIMALARKAPDSNSTVVCIQTEP